MEKMFNIVVTGNFDFRQNPVFPKFDLKKFTMELGGKIVNENDFRIITYGTDHKTHTEDHVSIDYLIAKGASDKLSFSQILEQILTIIPSINFPERHDIGRVETTKTGHDYGLLEMVIQGDMVCCIGGDHGANEVSDLGFMLEKPVLPIPCTGGKAEDLWFANKQDIIKEFSITNKEEKILVDCKKYSNELIETIMIILRRKFGPPCFVAIPYGGIFEKIYDDAIFPGLQSAGFSPHRLKDNLKPQEMIGQIFEQIRNCQLFLADITRHNPNVMMEVGMASSYGKKIILIRSIDIDDPGRKENPFNVTTIPTIKYDVGNLKKLKKDIETIASNS